MGFITIRASMIDVALRGVEQTVLVRPRASAR